MHSTYLRTQHVGCTHCELGDAPCIYRSLPPGRRTERARHKEQIAGLVGRSLVGFLFFFSPVTPSLRAWLLQTHKGARSVNHVNVLFSRCTFIWVQLGATLFPAESITLENALQRRRRGEERGEKKKHHPAPSVIPHCIIVSQSRSSTHGALCGRTPGVEAGVRAQRQKKTNNDSAKAAGESCTAARPHGRPAILPV